MRDEEKILAELQARATDPQHGQALTDHCRALVEEFESRASQGLTDLITDEMKRLRTDFDTTYTALMQKMGLNPGGSG